VQQWPHRPIEAFQYDGDNRRPINVLERVIKGRFASDFCRSIDTAQPPTGFASRRLRRWDWRGAVFGTPRQKLTPSRTSPKILSCNIHVAAIALPETSDFGIF